MTNPARASIERLLSPTTPEYNYFQHLCDMEDADESGAIESGRRYTALEHGVRMSGNAVSAIENAELFMAFLRGETKTKPKA